MRHPAVTLLLALAPLASGCVRNYRPPTPDEPHAIVKFRRVYETSHGETLNEVAHINSDIGLSEQANSAESSAPRTDAILVHPEPMNVSFAASFTHSESRQVMETYYVSVPHQRSESYNCGTYQQPRSCTRTVTDYRQEPRQRWVTRTQDVVDATCGRTVPLAPVVGHSYLFQYTFQENGVCHMSCFEQIPTGDDQFQNAQCPSRPQVDPG